MPVPCTSIGSAIWSHTRRTGFNACIAPWNTTDASAQRTARNRPHDMDATSTPSSRTCPPVVAVRGSSRSTVIASVDLPDPDSPAMPSVCPAVTVRSTPRTASTGPRADA